MADAPAAPEPSTSTAPAIAQPELPAALKGKSDEEVEAVKQKIATQGGCG